MIYKKVDVFLSTSISNEQAGHVAGIGVILVAILVRPGRRILALKSLFQKNAALKINERDSFQAYHWMDRGVNSYSRY